MLANAKNSIFFQLSLNGSRYEGSQIWKSEILFKVDQTIKGSSILNLFL